MPVIRNATPGDLEGIYRLINELEDAVIDKAAFERIFESNIQNQRILYFVAEIKGEAIGFISLHLQELLHHAETVGEIQELIVQKAHQNTGVGKSLFEYVKLASLENGCRHIEVCCNKKRVNAHEFYYSMGMTNQHYKFCLNI